MIYRYTRNLYIRFDTHHIDTWCIEWRDRVPEGDGGGERRPELPFPISPAQKILSWLASSDPAWLYPIASIRSGSLPVPLDSLRTESACPKSFSLSVCGKAEPAAVRLGEDPKIAVRSALNHLCRNDFSRSLH